LVIAFAFGCGDSVESIFAEAGWDVHAVPEDAFAPAAVTIDVRGGETYGYGERDERRLAAFLEA